MRKEKLGLAILISLCIVVGMMVTYAEGGVAINSLSASIDLKKEVKIEGYMSEGAGNIIGVRVISTDEANLLNYVNQVTTGEGGYFSIIYTMKDAKAGVTYEVTIRATNAATKAYTTAKTTFIYKPSVVETGGSTTPIISDQVTKLALEGNIVRIIPTQTFDGSLERAYSRLDTRTLSDALLKISGVADESKRVKIEVPKVSGANSYEVEIPAEFITARPISQRIEINSEVASITVLGNFLEPIQGTKPASNVSFTFNKINKSQLSNEMQKTIGNGTIIDFSLNIDGVPVSWSNVNSPVSISIQYTPTAEELKNPEHITVWYLYNGKEVPVPNARYDVVRGVVTFETTHFSSFAIVTVYKTFDDLENFKWARNAIEVLCSKGISSGTSSSTFSPEKKITRGDFITLLVKTLGLSSKESNSFEDVKPTDYFYEAVCTAKKLGITKGVSDNLFCPKAEISRQDMMVMTKLAMLAAGKIEKTNIDTAELDRFKDKAKISNYALESISVLVKEGLIMGSGNNIYPKNNTTRAEAAALLYKIYNK